ncbi:hypothetical protein [Bradyrhizobium sp. BR 1433]|uniref:hypothetical protein n=1 Tax=Bradyrhizobium sp. BR 1433 TaxID=3447967 RepID=UPI003EE6E086
MTAVKLSTVSLIPTSLGGACQRGAVEAEPSAAEPISTVRAGRTVNRRSFMNMITSTAAVVAVPTAAPAMPATSDIRAAHAYAAWLHMERRILCNELWPDMGSMAEKIVFSDNAGANWHLRNDDWKSDPQPSSRAAAVLDLVGVDWRSGDHDCALNHRDSGRRPQLPSGWPRVDSELIALAAQFEPLLDKYIVQYAAWGRQYAKAEADERFGEHPAAKHGCDADRQGKIFR